MKQYLLLFLLLFSFNLQAQRIEDDSERLDSLLRVHKNMHFYRSPTTGNADSVFHRRTKQYLYFDSDSIFRQFVHKGGFSGIPNEMDYYYYAVLTEMPPERAASEMNKMEQAAKKMRSKALIREVDYMRACYLQQETKKDLDEKINRLREVADKAVAGKDTILQIRAMASVFSLFRYSGRAPEALEEGLLISKILDKVNDEKELILHNIYFQLGEMYYTYGNYAQAIPLLEKATKSTRYFYDRTKFQALNTLGIYYRDENNLALSDYYFRHILESKEWVKDRGEYDAIAICNLGKNCLLRKEYEKAERLLKTGLPVMIASGDYGFAAGVYMALGNCYLGLKDLPKTKHMIDSAKIAITINHTPDQYRAWYPIVSKYYALTGNIPASTSYMDSTVLALTSYSDRYNASRILQAELKLFDAERKAKEEQLNTERLKKENYRNLLFSGITLLVLAFGAYVTYSEVIKRKKRLLYKHIVEEDKIQSKLFGARDELFRLHQLADKTTKVNGQKNGDALMLRLHELMRTEQLFTNPELTRKILADCLNTNENYLISAIRENFGDQTFSDYINNLRLSHALYLLKNSNDKIESIAVDSGFSSYKYFHTLFRKQYDMSPSEFRKLSDESA